jgi:hypothetical protein
MKHIYTAVLAALFCGLCQGQLVSTSPVSNDAVGPSIAVFTSTEQTPRTIIRIAYADGVSSGGLGANVYVRDYDSTLSLIGERKIVRSGASPAYTRPRLSRDGLGIVFYSRATSMGAFTPTMAELASTPYSSTGTITGQAASYGGADAENSLCASTAILTTAMEIPPAISDIDESDNFHIIFRDMCAETPGEGGPYTPLMHWEVEFGGGQSEDDINGSNGYSQPAINSDATYLVYVNGNQVYRAYSSTVGNWLNGTVTTVSYYSSSNGNAASMHPEIDGPGATVVFASDATNLRANDTSGMRDIYTWTSGGGPVLAYDDPDEDANTSADYPSISPDGGWVGFESSNRNFLSGSVDYNNRLGPFVYRVEVGDPDSLEIMSYTAGSPILARLGNAAAIANSGRFVFQSGDTGMVDDDDRVGIDIIYIGS